mgnify:FL=1|tara:strand:+ start:431 stop:631 length:201 start_codon:yes stop_codon:yes gene_type:complete
MPAKTKARHEGRAVKVTTPTLYGSHRSMVVKELDNGKVVCEDDLGEYTTHTSKLDNGLADPSRWSR